VSTVSVSPQVLRSLGQVPAAGARGDPGAGKLVIALRNGADARVRPICTDDGPRLLSLCHRLSPDTVYQRLFSLRQPRQDDADAFAGGDCRERMAVVGETDNRKDAQVMGLARDGRRLKGQGINDSSSTRMMFWEEQVHGR
jgi:hypothetical protein